MKTRITITFSCPVNTARIINEYSTRLGITRSACIAMMCNEYIANDFRNSAETIIVEPVNGGEKNAD